MPLYGNRQGKEGGGTGDGPEKELLHFVTVRDIALRLCFVYIINTKLIAVSADVETYSMVLVLYS